MYSRVIATGSALPDKRVTNDDLAAQLLKDGIETSDEWIRTRTGILERRFADPEKGETTTSLAVAAARQALDRSGLKAEDIDLIIVATTTPDMVFHQRPHAFKARSARRGAQPLTFRLSALASSMRSTLPTPCCARGPTVPPL